jgi:hypothetical protein
MAALAGNDHFVVQAGIELEPGFADVWQAALPEAALIQADNRRSRVFFADTTANSAIAKTPFAMSNRPMTMISKVT